jgi:hypothetical protein
MNQSERELRLDRLIDQLIAGDELDTSDDADLAALIGVAREVRQHRDGLPTTGFETRLSSQVARSLGQSAVAVGPNGHDAISANGYEMSRIPSSLPVAIPPTTLKPRRRWLREIGQAVAAGLVLLLVGALLVALFDDRVHNDGIVGQGTLGHEGQSLVATPAGTPEGPQTPWEANAAAHELYGRRLGKDLHLVQRAGDFAITLNWAGDDGNQLFIYYTISGPKDQSFNSMMLYGTSLTLSGANLTLTDSARVDSIAGAGTGMTDSSTDELDWFNSSRLPQSGSRDLRFTAAAIYAVVPFSPTATPPAGFHLVTPTSGDDSGILPPDSSGLPQYQYRPGDPVAFLKIPGPFTFDFSVPVTPLPPSGTPASGTPTPSSATPATSLTLDAAEQSVRTFLNDPDAKLDGHLVDTSTDNAGAEIMFPPAPGEPLYLITRKDQDLPRRDTFIVDANGGAVLRAVLPSRASDAPLATPLSDDKARTTAENFARQHFSGQFDQLSPVENPFAPDRRYLIMNPDPATSQPVVEFDWRLRSSANGGWLPTWVTVDVDRATGNVVQYVARTSGTDRIAPPTLTKEQAIQIALKEAQKNGSTSGVTATAGLMTTFWDRQSEIWVWVVELNGMPAASDGSATLSGVEVNARTGKITVHMMTVQ